MVDLRYVPKTSDYKQRIVTEKPILQKHNVYSHNFCDKTSWITNSIRVVDEIAENIGDNQTYQLDNYNIIDTYHGKLIQEDYLLDDDSYSYRVSLKVNNIDGYIEQDPHYGTGGDYTIDYQNACINFLYQLNPSDEVKVTYHYATDSTFIVGVPVGKKAIIFNVEAQFSEDIIMNDTIMYQVYVYNPYYPIGPLKVPYGNPTKYKTITNMQTEANKAYPMYPSISGSTWRGINQGMLILNWDYLGADALLSSVGAEIRVSLEHNNPLGGTFSTLTFYGIKENE